MDRSRAGVYGNGRLDGTTAANYLYNGHGEQLRRSRGSDVVTFVYNEGGQLLGQYDGTGQTTQQYIWLDGLPVGVQAGGSLHYVEPDHLGTPRAIIDPLRDVAVWQWDLKSEAFGNRPPNEDPDLDGATFRLDLRLPGQRHDQASGLNYNYFRDYDPAAATCKVTRVGSMEG